jgi:DDE superfamily endonuclease.
MKLWTNRVCERRKGALLKKSSLVVLDQFNSHLKNFMKEKLRQENTKLAVIVGRLTSQLQLLDISINKTKVYIRDNMNS